MSRATASAMPATAISDRERRSSAYSVLVRRFGRAPPVTRSVACADHRLEPVLEHADRPDRNAASGRLSQPPTTLSTPSTTSGPVMIHGASCRCVALLLAGAVRAVEGVEHHPRHVDRGQERRGEPEHVDDVEHAHCPECRASVASASVESLRAREHGAEDLVLREEAGERRNARRSPASRSTSARRSTGMYCLSPPMLRMSCASSWLRVW